MPDDPLNTLLSADAVVAVLRALPPIDLWAVVWNLASLYWLIFMLGTLMVVISSAPARLDWWRISSRLLVSYGYWRWRLPYLASLGLAILSLTVQPIPISIILLPGLLWFTMAAPLALCGELAGMATGNEAVFGPRQAGDIWQGVIGHYVIRRRLSWLIGRRRQMRMFAQNQDVMGWRAIGKAGLQPGRPVLVLPAWVICGALMLGGHPSFAALLLLGMYIWGLLREGKSLARTARRIARWKLAARERRRGTQTSNPMERFMPESLNGGFHHG